MAKALNHFEDEAACERAAIVIGASTITPDQEAQLRLLTAQDAMHCALDWLRMEQPAKAIEVLESTLR